MASKSHTTTDHDEIRRWVASGMAFLSQEEKADGSDRTVSELVRR